MTENPPQVPVYKIGAVVLHPEGEQVLILRPKPKQQGEIPPFVLPRGSRAYAIPHADGSHTWQDARDDETARTHADALEPIEQTLTRELGEEAGVSPAQLAAAQVTDIGTRPFHSRSKGLYAIHWFVVRLDAAAAHAVMQQLPEDALELRWETVQNIKDMATKNEFSSGYVAVLEEVLMPIVECDNTI